MSGKRFIWIIIITFIIVLAEAFHATVSYFTILCISVEGRDGYITGTPMKRIPNWFHCRISYKRKHCSVSFRTITTKSENKSPETIAAMR